MSGTENKHRISFITLTIIFFMWGFITVMNDVLINTFGPLFNLSTTQLSYIQLSFFGTFLIVSLIYFLISTISGKDPINKIGYKTGMGISLLICALGCGTFYFAGLNNSYGQFIISLFVLSIGVTLLQICANPYATILGPEKTASSRLNLAQGLNSLGTTIGPIVGNILIYSVFSDGSKSVSSVGYTYMLYGVVFLVMAIVVFMSKFPPFKNETSISGGLEIFKNRNLVFGIVAIFFYVGAEVAVGSWIGRFSKEEHIMGLDEQSANYFLSFFWGGLMIGRLVGSVAMNQSYNGIKKYLKMTLISLAIFSVIWLANGLKVDKYGIAWVPLSFNEIKIYLLFMTINLFAFGIGKGKPARLIAVFSIINCILIIIGIISEGALAFWAILGTGLFFSIGWSNIFALSIKNLGKYTSQGSSLLVMAIFGGAIIPLIQGKIAEEFSIQLSFIVPLMAILYLIFFGISGYKPNSAKKDNH
ncbi:MFS transporter [Paracrocinitomix mangrovi]|uniref:MFS transporter n=1 Tax=Paracrocinitomix mangrovi TaxID=2862509 RepID=UPI001C8E2974|nr:MFS transporter [Paracrocinitomix mangrovi]UKN02076.1 MFS transporter [Paracrocinitomix mangrovi]